MDSLLLLLIPVIALVSLALALCMAAARADAIESLDRDRAEARRLDGFESAPKAPSVFLVDEWGEREQLIELRPARGRTRGGADGCERTPITAPGRCDAVEATGERLRREFQLKRRSWLAAFSATPVKRSGL